MLVLVRMQVHCDFPVVLLSTHGVFRLNTAFNYISRCLQKLVDKIHLVFDTTEVRIGYDKIVCFLLCLEVNLGFELSAENVVGEVADLLEVDILVLGYVVEVLFLGLIK